MREPFEDFCGLVLALHPLAARNLALTRRIDQNVGSLDRTLSLVMGDDQTSWSDAGAGQLERMRRRAVGEKFFAAAKHDRHGESADRVDEVVGEQCVNELGAALCDEVGAVFLLQTLYGVDVAQEH